MKINKRHSLKGSEYFVTIRDSGSVFIKVGSKYLDLDYIVDFLIEEDFE